MGTDRIDPVRSELILLCVYKTASVLRVHFSGEPCWETKAFIAFCSSLAVPSCLFFFFFWQSSKIARFPLGFAEIFYLTLWLVALYSRSLEGKSFHMTGCPSPCLLSCYILGALISHSSGSAKTRSFISLPLWVYQKVLLASLPLCSGAMSRLSVSSTVPRIGKFQGVKASIHRIWLFILQLSSLWILATHILIVSPAIRGL